MNSPKIDIYNHVMPPSYVELVKKYGKEPGMIKRMSNLRMLWDMEARAKMLDDFPDVQQVISLAVPSPDMLGGPEQSPEFARVANEGMAAICKQYPTKFPYFVASLPMNNPAAALEEMDFAITQLGAKGIQILTSVNGRPLDEPDIFPIFERITNHHRMPVWMHPTRPGSRADYPNESASKYEIWQVLGWPVESSVAMSRMVFSGLLERLPELRLITHHCGGMLPYFSGRAETLWAQLGSRSVDPADSEVLKKLSKPPIDYFKMFYGDTVLGGSSSALRCGLDFFGADKVVFASDCPFDPEEGPMFIREGIRSIEDLNLNVDDARKLYFGNAFKLLGLQIQKNHFVHLGNFMTDTIKLKAQVLVLDIDSKIASDIDAFCEAHFLQAMRVTEKKILSVLSSKVDLGAIFISERLESDKQGGIDLGKRIRKIRPELPLYLRRHDTTGLADLKAYEQRAFRQGYQIEQIADLAQDLEKSISSHLYPNQFVRGICEITQFTLQSQFKNLKLEVESPFIVSDHLIYGDIFTLIPIETSWCRGYMSLQANEEELVEFVLAEKTRFESPKNKNAFDQYAFVGEVTNMVWGAFKNRFNDFQAVAGSLPQVPIVIKHLDRYISFGSKNPQLSLRCVLTDPENENSKPVEIFQRFVFNLGWSPDDYKDNQAQMEQLVDAGELELF